MHFIVRSLILISAWCLCFEAFGAEEPADEVIVTDQPADPAPLATPEPPPARARAAELPELPAEPIEVAEPEALPEESEPLEPFEFDGIQPGVSTSADVRKLWGEPLGARQHAPMASYAYAREPFKQVEVTLRNDLVDSITVTLNERFAADEVAEQLQLANIDPVPLVDDAETCVGQAYPERGVVLRWPTIDVAPEDAGEHEVAEVAFGPIEPRHFLLRAEARFDNEDSGALADVNQALRREPRSPQALGLKARLLWRAGRNDEALEAVSGALQADPKNPEHRLLYARLLAESGNHKQALAETQQAISLSDASAVTRARGLVQLGELIAAGPEPDYQRPIELYQQAIKLADSMVGDSHASVRRNAGEALLDAHLAMAYSIAWGHWKMKPIAVEKWLERAELLAQETGDGDRLDACGELRICQSALAACVGAQGKVDPARWAERAWKAGRDQLSKSRDPLCRQRLNWQLGLAFHDALQVFQMRQEFDSALKYGGAAARCLEQGARGRRLTADESHMLGRLCFRLGTLYAMRLGEHRTAIAWYNRALPLLEQQADREANLGQQGEALVTAAISYWNERQRDKAVSLTERGIELLEQAAERGEIDKTALTIPYSNLAAMHEQLGDRVQAASYAEQASSLGGESAEKE